MGELLKLILSSVGLPIILSIGTAFITARVTGSRLHRKLTKGQRESTIKDSSVTLEIKDTIRDSIICEPDNELCFCLDFAFKEPEEGSGANVYLTHTEPSALNRLESMVTALTLTNISDKPAALSKVTASLGGQEHVLLFSSAIVYKIPPKREVTIYVSKTKRPLAISLDYPDCTLSFKEINELPPSIRTPMVEEIWPRTKRKQKQRKQI